MEKPWPQNANEDIVMQFEAELKGRSYRVQISETRDLWKISIFPLDGSQLEARHHSIPKTDFATFDQTISFLYKNSSYLVDVVQTDQTFDVFTRGSYRSIQLVNDQMRLNQSLKGGLQGSRDKQIKSGMPGKIIKLHVSEGQAVEVGDPLLVMEAMKMENEIRSPQSGTIAKIFVEEGKNVEANGALIEFANTPS